MFFMPHSVVDRKADKPKNIARIFGGGNNTLLHNGRQRTNQNWKDWTALYLTDSLAQFLFNQNIFPEILRVRPVQKINF